jgi:hypothetical protein
VLMGEDETWWTSTPAAECTTLSLAVLGPRTRGMLEPSLAVFAASGRNLGSWSFVHNF